MEGSAAYARDCLKADLRNTRSILGLLVDSGGAEEVVRPLERLVQEVTLGLREAGWLTLADLDALRCAAVAAAEVAARDHRLADDTLRQWVRSFERVLPWWACLPATETLLADERWPAPAPGALAIELRVTADERFRVQRLPRTRDAVRARFEKYVSKHPAIGELRLVDEDGELVLALEPPRLGRGGDDAARASALAL